MGKISHFGCLVVNIPRFLGVSGFAEKPYLALAERGPFGVDALPFACARIASHIDLGRGRGPP